MALPTPITLTGSVVKIGTTDIADGTVNMSLTLQRETSSVYTFGGKVSDVGSLGGNDNIEAVYDETASSGFLLLHAELLTPTDGGLAVTFQPKGAGASTNYEYTFNIVVSQADIGGSASDIVTVPFTFETTGAIGYAVQSA